MKELFCVICGRNRKFEKSKHSLVPHIIWSKCKNEDEKIFKDEESVDLLKILSLILIAWLL